MKRMKLVMCAIVMALVSSAVTRAVDAVWIEDFEVATARAEKEKKDLLMDFTGSDWCHWCIQLKKEVLSQDAFVADAGKNFVMVELDYPKGKPQPAKIKDQNTLMSKAFKIQGFPTIILADSQGRGYAKTGYQEGGVEPYLKHLATLREVKTKRDELFAKAEKAQGVEKAKLLDAALAVIPDEARIGYDEIVKQILELDADGKGGLKAKYASQKQADALLALLEKGDAEGAQKMMAEIVANPATPPALKQQTYLWKAQLLNSTGDKKAVIEALEQARIAAPDTEMGQQIPRIIEQVKKAEADKGAAPKDAAPKP